MQLYDAEDIEVISAKFACFGSLPPRVQSLKPTKQGYFWVIYGKVNPESQQPSSARWGFKYAWIKRELYKDLPRLVGQADFNKFKAALKKGLVPPVGSSGIKKLNLSVGEYTHELKIGGSGQRLLGKIDKNGILVFAKFLRGGLH